MMKKHLLALFVFCLCLTLFYLVGAFINWNLNAQYWDLTARMIVGILGFVISIWLAVGVYMFSED